MLFGGEGLVVLEAILGLRVVGKGEEGFGVVIVRLRHFGRFFSCWWIGIWFGKSMWGSAVELLRRGAKTPVVGECGYGRYGLETLL